MATDGWTRVSVRRTHLELRTPDELRPARPPAMRAELVRRRPIAVDDYRSLYTLVGELWLWRDRLIWTDEELERYLALPEVHVWSAHIGDATVAEMMYFGLAPAFIGRGLGGWLLTRASQEAFALDAPRVVLNTCTLDAPQALPNYLARGYTIVSEDQYLLDVPARGLAAAERPTHRS